MPIADLTPEVDQDEDGDLVTDILELRRRSDSHLADWRKDARAWYGMVSGDQWDEADRKYAEEMGKPCVVFNRTAVVVNAICGSEANNRQEVAYRARTVDDAGGNDLLTQAAKWAREQCDAEDEDSDAFRDMVICGYGWTETKMDYESNPDGMVAVVRRDPGAFHYDPSAVKRNLTDARWVQCDDWLDEDSIKARWPDAEIVATGDGMLPSTTPHDATTAPLYLKSATEDTPDGTHLVIHHCWVEKEVYWKVQKPVDPMLAQAAAMAGQAPPAPVVEEMSEEDYQVALARSTQMGIELQGRRLTRKVYMEAYLLGRQLLASGKAPCQDGGFIYKCMTGYRDREAGTFHGVVKFVVDPQKYANKMLSQLLHMINTNAKGGIMVETGAVDDIRKLEDTWAKTDGVTLVNAGAISGGKIQPKPIPQYPQSIPDLLTLSISSIRDGAGVPLEMLGLADRMQPGIVEEARTQSGLGNVATLFDSLRQYRKQHGRLLAHFLLNYMSDGRLVRVAGPVAEQYVPFVRQRDVLDYDVVVDVAPTSRDMRTKAFEALLKLVPMVMEAGGPVPEEALDYAPIPTQLANSWKKQIAAQKAQGPKPDPQVQIAQAVAQTEASKTQAVQAKGQIEIELAKLGLARAQQELAFKQAESQMRAQEHEQTMAVGALKMRQATVNDDADNRTKLVIARMEDLTERWKVMMELHQARLGMQAASDTVQ